MLLTSIVKMKAEFIQAVFCNPFYLFASPVYSIPVKFKLQNIVREFIKKIGKILGKSTVFT